MAEERIQQRINDNIADIPIFYGQPDKDTITLAYYVSRIDPGVSALTWTQANAYVAFQNSLKGAAADWLNYFSTLNRQIAKEWNTIKPHFRKAFGDKTDPMVFANSMFNIKLTGNVYTYAATITDIMNLHIEKYLASAIAFPAGHTYSAAQQLEIKSFLDAGFHEVHDDLIKEFFLGGLPQETKIKVANKPNMDTVGQIIDFLVNEQNIAEKKKNGLLSELKPTTPPASAGTIHAVTTEPPTFTPEEALAAIQFQNSFRGQSRGRGNRGGTRGRGGPPRGQHSFPGAAGPNPSQRGGAQGAPQRGGNTGGGAIQKDAFCIYCHKKFHKQEECRSRIRDNAPCYSPSGTAYFPKVINSAEEAEQQDNIDSVHFDFSETTESVFH